MLFLSSPKVWECSHKYLYCFICCYNFPTYLDVFTPPRAPSSSWIKDETRTGAATVQVLVQVDWWN